MKKLLLIIMAMMLILTSCGQKQIDVKAEVKESPTVSVAKEGKTILHYQGYVTLEFSELKNAESVEVNNITFSENQNGKLTLHKGGNKIFEPDDIANIERDSQDTAKYSKYLFEKNDIVTKDKQSSVKLQYLISNVSVETPKDDLVRNVKLTMVVLNSNGKSIASKDVEFNLPLT